MHGYELRKHLNVTLGTIRTLSYGWLYPCLKALVAGGWIEQADTAAPPHALAGRRARIVYRLTTAGKERLADSLAQTGPAAWEDESFAVRFSLFHETDPQTRLQLLEGRRARMVYRPHTAGKERLADSLAQTGPAAWEDESFAVRFSLFHETDPQTRLQLLEGRRARMLQRRASMREQVRAGRERRDRYTLELQRHGLDLIEKEIGWLEELIVAERTDHPRLDHPQEKP